MLRKIIQLTIVGLWAVRMCSADPYPTNYCMCQLDAHLRQVVKDLSANNSYPPTPVPPPTTTTTTKPTTDDNLSAVNTTESPTDPTTQPPPPPAQKRKKRETTNTDNQGKTYELGVMDPTGKVSYDLSVTLSDTDGVNYSAKYNASLCQCKKGSTAELAFCLLNVPYNESVHSDPKSPETRQHINKLLPWLDNNFRKELNSYLRTLPLKFSNFEGKLQPRFQVELHNRVYSPTYEVRTAFETQQVRSGSFLNYETAIDDKNCYNVQDTTVPELRKSSMMDWARYIFLILAIVVFALLSLFLCCGKRDQFYIRFW